MTPTLFCQVNDQGVDIVITITQVDGTLVPLLNTDGLVVRLGYPDGTTANFAARLLTDGSDGKAVYTTGAGDISQEGIYNVQLQLTRAGNVRSSRRGQFEALENVDG